MHRDNLMNAPAAEVAEASMAVIDRLQDRRPHAQVAGAAAVFMMLCQHHGVRPSDAFTAAGNMMENTMGVTPEFRAVREYIKHELPR